MKTTNALSLTVAVLVAFMAATDIRADDLATAATKASASAKRPIGASPHDLEDFPWALWGYPVPTQKTGPGLVATTYPGDLVAAAARASAFAKRPIAASPHTLENFPWALLGYPPPTVAAKPVQCARTYPDNLAMAAAKASALVKRPVAANPHALEEFPWLLCGCSSQVATNSDLLKVRIYQIFGQSI